MGGTHDERMKFVTDMMRELSVQTEPADMVAVYGRWMSSLLQIDRRVSLSRRGLEYPWVRVTRSDLQPQIDPWENQAALPVINGGLLSELIWTEEPIVMNDLVVPESDPSHRYFEGMRSLSAIPLFEAGHALNMVVSMRREADGFIDGTLPELLWLSNLFGRATSNLVLAKKVKQAYAAVDRELKVVEDIQRSLLPMELPKIKGFELAAFYQTSKRAGGDYYDFFPLPDGRLGILIADVSGHGTPAAVMMAVTHSIAHLHVGAPTSPGALLNFINRHLAARYTNGTGTFVTAFYGIYDPVTRELTFSNAGHNPPRIKRGSGGPNGIIEALDRHLPLGIDGDENYLDTVQTLSSGDTLVLYTDGITEARAIGEETELFGTDRLDEVINACTGPAQELIDCTVQTVKEFTRNAPPGDDRTMLVARVS